MANIQSYLDAIANAEKGEDVRWSIHDAIEAINTDVNTAVTKSNQASTSAANSANAASQSAASAQSAANSAANVAAVQNIILDKGINHKNIYRGKNLGSKLTNEQKNAIITGSFDDLYIGDYWEGSMGEGNAACCMMIADILYTTSKGISCLITYGSSYWCASSISDTLLSWPNSFPIQQGIDSNYKNIWENGFNCQIQETNWYYPIYSNGVIINSGIFKTPLRLLSQSQIFGFSTNEAIASDKVYSNGLNERQLSIFKLNPNDIYDGQDMKYFSSSTVYWTAFPTTNGICDSVSNGVPYSLNPSSQALRRYLVIVTG